MPQPEPPPTMEAPVLETPRLILRGHHQHDLASGFAMWSNPSVVEHITGKPSTKEESWGRILRYAGHWRLMGFGYWAVVEKASGRFVGDVGFGNYKRTVEPPLGDNPEIGWVLDPAFHGRGYATEAVRAALAWMDPRSGMSTVCIVAPENTTSLRVAEKCGYRPSGWATYMDCEIIVLRREVDP